MNEVKDTVLDSSIASLDEDFNFQFLLNFLNRNKILILSFSFIFFIIACIYSLLQKKTWEGQFQIVLKTEDTMNATPLGQTLKLAEISNSSSNLRTEVGILESPSVLMPVYEYVIASKDPKSLSSLRKHIMSIVILLLRSEIFSK